MLGAGEPQRARVTAYTAAGIIGAITTTAAVSLSGQRHAWAASFSPDDATAAALIASCLPLVSIYIALDAIGIGRNSDLPKSSTVRHES